MSLRFKNLNTVAVALIFSVFVVAALFGAGHFGAHLPGIISSDCPFMPGFSLCGMALFDHISSWQSLFSSLPSQIFSLLITLILALLAAASVNFLIYTVLLTHRTIPEFSLSGWEYIPKSHLSEAFSGGILNPKLF